jgi:hypothetical protein
LSPTKPSRDGELLDHVRGHPCFIPIHREHEHGLKPAAGLKDYMDFVTLGHHGRATSTAGVTVTRRAADWQPFASMYQTTRPPVPLLMLKQAYDEQPYAFGAQPPATSNERSPAWQHSMIRTSASF